MDPLQDTRLQQLPKRDADRSLPQVQKVFAEKVRPGTDDNEANRPANDRPAELASQPAPEARQSGDFTSFPITTHASA